MHVHDVLPQVRGKRHHGQQTTQAIHNTLSLRSAK